MKKKKEHCPICLGGKKVTSSSGSALDVEYERPCGYCHGTGKARDKPLYSAVEKEEVRIWEIRDSPSDRVREIARTRLGNRHLPLHPSEMLWLREGLRANSIPMLSPAEWDVITFILMTLVSGETVAARRTEWERQQKL